MMLAFSTMPHFPTLTFPGRIYPKINKAEALVCLLLCPVQGLGATVSFVFTIYILFLKEDPTPVLQTYKAYMHAYSLPVITSAILSSGSSRNWLHPNL